MQKSDSGSARKDAPQEVLAVLARYEDAFNSNDPDAMASLFTSDCTFVNFGGTLVIGREDLHRAQVQVFGAGGPLEAIEVTYTPEHAALWDDDRAVVHARQRSRAAGEPALRDPMEAVFTVVLDRAEGEWRIRLGQNTPGTR